MPHQRKFSPGFKLEAVQMTAGINLSIKQVAADLGIHTNVLGRWCREQRVMG